MKRMFFGFLLGLIFTACASKVIVPALHNKILLIDQDYPGLLFFPYCRDYKFWNKTECKKKERIVEVYDLKDKGTRVLLRDFVVVHRSKVGL